MFASSTHPTDCLGRTTLDPRPTVRVGGVTAHNGDLLVVVDEDGVVIIPRSKSAEILAAAETKAAAERSALQMLLSEGSGVRPERARRPVTAKGERYDEATART